MKTAHTARIEPCKTNKGKLILSSNRVSHYNMGMVTQSNDIIEDHSCKNSKLKITNIIVMKITKDQIE